MSGIKLAPLLLLVALCTLAMPSIAALGDGVQGAPPPRPSAALTADDVVRIVIRALAENDIPHANAGIETTFAFASPANRVNTGPLSRFIRMVRSEPYGIMVDHVASEFSEVVYTSNTAYQMVHLTGADGRAVVFAFRLSKQRDGEFKDMWMTDAVWPVANTAVPQPGF